MKGLVSHASDEYERQLKKKYASKRIILSTPSYAAILHTMLKAAMTYFQFKHSSFIQTMTVGTVVATVRAYI